MFTGSDATLAAPFAEDDPFSYGDQTVLQLRAQPFAIQQPFVAQQPFAVQDEIGTVVTMPIDTTPRQPLASVPRETVFAEEDPIARLERKLDAAMQQIAAMQQRLESLDLTLARALSR